MADHRAIQARPAGRAIALVIAAGAFFLSACTTPPSKPTVPPEQLWEQRHRQLSELDHWRLEGRIGFVSEHDSGSASLYWEQNGDAYELRVVAPFGQGSLLVQGGPDGVVLQDNDGERVQADDPGYLIWQRTGWVIPVARLRYWIMGMPAEEGPLTDYRLDARGRLETLRNRIWTVDYSDYQAIDARDGLMLPAKVQLKSPDWKIKVAVRRWALY